MMLEQVPAILWTTDKELTITSSIGSGLKRIKTKPNEKVGVNLYEYYQTDDPDFPPISAHIRALRGESETQELEWRNRSYLSVRTGQEGNQSQRFKNTPG